MKRHHTFLAAVLLLAAAATLTGCLDDDTSPHDPTATRLLAAKINGTEWTAISPTATRIVPPAAMTVVGSGDGTQLTLNIRAAAIGTYQLGGTTHVAICRHNGTEFTTKQAGAKGNITITAYDEANKLISGNFTFTARTAAGESLTVNGGRFVNVKWAEQ